MGLLQNISVLNAEPIKNMGGSSGNVVTRTSYNRPEQVLNKYAGFAGINSKSGVPDGHLPPHQLAMPLKSGGISSFKDIIGTGSPAMRLAGGLNASATSYGAGTIPNPSGSIIAWILSSIRGIGRFKDPPVPIGLVHIESEIRASGGISTAGLGSLVAILANLYGSGEFVDPFAVGSVFMSALMDGESSLGAGIQGAVRMASTISSSGALSGTSVGIWNMLADLSGAGTFESDIVARASIMSLLEGDASFGSSLLRAVGHMSSILGAETSEMNENTIAYAVWSASADANSAPGTMGEKLNTAGGGSDPEAIAEAVGERLLEGDITLDQALRIILAALSGTTDGIGTTDERYQSVDGEKSRLTVTFDGSGNRATVIRDGT